MRQKKLANWRYDIKPIQQRPDTFAFLRLLEQICRDRAAPFFAADSDIWIARAPGRLDVMGGIADYSGSLVLEMPLAEATFAALQRTPDTHLIVRSYQMQSAEFNDEVSIPMSELQQEASKVQQRLKQDPKTAWVAYVAGAIPILHQEKQISFQGGARIFIWSRVPPGKGVSSSAALEVASMQTIATAWDIPLSPREIAIFCQKVENYVVGAPCGLMDQLTAVFGESNKLLPIICQPDICLPLVSIPEDIAFIGIDSGIAHSVEGADYGSVRIGAFMGYRIIADKLGLPWQKHPSRTYLEVKDPHFHGYLANVTPSRFERDFRDHLPEKILGQDFLRQYTETPDPVIRPQPDRTYAVRYPTKHPIYENHRTQIFLKLLNSYHYLPDETVLHLLGELMHQSHQSYSDCGLGSSRTDEIVAWTQHFGSKHGVYGAKITGGGSGGTVAVLIRKNHGEETVKKITQKYGQQHRFEPFLFMDSSPGANSFGVIRLKAAT